MLLRGAAFRNCDTAKIQNLTSFEQLMDLEWNIKISSSALPTVHKRKLNTTELLPITSDLVKLSKYLDSELKSLTDELNRSASQNTWKRLATVALARIILFNKRRSGEAARMTLHQYTTRPRWTEQGT